MNTQMVTGFVSVVGAFALAASAVGQVTLKGPGSTIRVGPDKGAGSDVDVELPGVKVQTRAAEAPRAGRVIEVPVGEVPVDKPLATEKQYRIGLAGGDVTPELRLHLGLDGVGVMVRELTPGGAAEKAGVHKFDILLAADGTPLAKIQDLVAVVRAAGPQQKPIALELLRRGKSITVNVTPAEVEVPVAPQPLPGGGLGGLGDGFGGGFGNGGQAGAPFQFRMFGPGFAIGQGGFEQGNFGQRVVQANGIRVQLQTENGQSVVTAQQGDQIWELDANDQEEIAKLPPEVRQMVEGVVNGQAGGVEIDLNKITPMAQGLMEMFRERRGARAGGGQNVQQRLEAMEQRMLEMQRRLLGEAFEGEAPAAAGGGVAPAFGGGAAPVFEPGDALDAEQPAKPVEIEIPVEDPGDSPEE